MILLGTQFQLPEDFQYVQIILNVMFGETHPDCVKMSHYSQSTLMNRIFINNYWLH